MTREPRADIKRVPEVRENGPDAPAPVRSSQARAWTILIVLLALSLGGFLILTRIQSVFQGADEAGIAIGVVMALVLSATPILISFAQSVSRDRQIEKLRTVESLPVGETRYFSVAILALEGIRPAVFDRYYTIPMLSLSFLVLICWMFILLAPFALWVFNHESIVLGGLSVLDISTDSSNGVALGKDIFYQRGTFVIISIAFIGSYVYSMGRIIERVNNNDIYPISYYYYAVRIIIACLVAGVVRHILPAFVGADVIALGVAFIVGFVPDLFIIATSRKVFQIIRIRGDQNDPDEQAIPTNVSLLMIQGMSREKADRLLELGIENAQVLANVNPFLLWARTPFDLLLIISWIGQAQLYIRVKEVGIKALRDLCINEISDLQVALKDKDAATSVAEALKIKESLLPALDRSIEADPSVSRFAELREKLRLAAAK
jgi:hypothetical protein